MVGFGHGSSFRLNQCGAAPGPHQHLCGGEPKVGLPVVSRPGFSQRVHPLGRQEPRVLVCAHDDVPATVVHNAVVRAAQERQVAGKSLMHPVGAYMVRCAEASAEVYCAHRMCLTQWTG